MTLIRTSPGRAGRVDWALVAAAGGLLVIGSLAMLSAASTTPYYSSVFRTHFVALGIGAAAFTLMLAFNYQIFQDQSRALYALALVLMVVTLLFGHVSRGHRSWLRVMGFGFQPGELARMLLILVLADVLDRRARRIESLSTLLTVLAVAAPILILILRQPDLSTTLSFVPALMGMLFCAGADVPQMLAVFGCGAAAFGMPLLYTFCSARFPDAAPHSLPALVLATSKSGWAALWTILLFAAAGALAWRLATWLRLQVKPLAFVVAPLLLSASLLSGLAIYGRLKGYQRDRFVAWVAPETDVQGAAYNVIQSRIAVGSGGLWGRGLFSGTQSQLGFLPERHTDFIFAGVGEEMGFVGCSLVLGLYMLLLWRIVAAARLARDRYGYLVCAGLASMLACHLALNVGMCVGLLPVAGLPLPLVSYGGTNLVVTLGALGIVANIYARRYALL
ncbi:MAG: rod shape-determining protein RodA [Elusimicrobia bacterium]|nr:rod shape-determining protein RodA [Elusimicrobiota bacterium]